MTGESKAQDRSGEKKGWLLGWLGGFVWAAILAVILISQGRIMHGLVGLLLTGVAVAFIGASAPWRYPDTPYWRLMLPIYAIFIATLAWALLSYDGIESLGLNRWSLFLLLPLLSPLLIGGTRTWRDRRPES